MDMSPTPTPFEVLEGDADDATCIVPSFSDETARQAARVLIEHTGVLFEPDAVTDDQLGPLVERLVSCRLRQRTHALCDDDDDYRVGWWTADGDGETEILGYSLESAFTAVERFAKTIPICSECGENGVVLTTDSVVPPPDGKVLIVERALPDGRTLHICRECQAELAAERTST